MHDEGTLLFRTKYTYVPTHNKLGVEVDGFAVSATNKKRLVLWVNTGTVPPHNKLGVEVGGFAVSGKKSCFCGSVLQRCLCHP